MKEAMQVYRERKKWKYGVRSRYVVKPDLVDSLMVHWVHASKGRNREVVVPQSAGVLAHFRQSMPEGVKLTGPKKQTDRLSMFTCPMSLLSTGERQADPRLAELVAKVVVKVEQVCDLLKTCTFVNTTKYS